MILVDNRNNTDPYINLAIEEYLVRYADCIGKDYVLLYVNEACIVVGKNQSIYKEINFEYLRNGKLKFCRRISGGGTVYHDIGNVCFAFISRFSEQKINNYRFFNQPVVNALAKAGVTAEMDVRNNILFGTKKISGSAQFTDRKNIISHGTILFNADLNMLRSCLGENDFKIETRAVGSVKSSVMNLMEATDKFSLVEELKGFLVQHLAGEEVYSFSNEEWYAIQNLADEKFRTLEWIYGKSPATKIIKDEFEVEVVDGKVVSVQSAKWSLSNLIGVPYQFNEIQNALNSSPHASEILKAVF